MSPIEKKIRKYTFKLKNAKTRKKADLYHEKLLKYHKINIQNGGKGTYEISKKLI